MHTNPKTTATTSRSEIVKRFTETQKWEETWFRRLPPGHKLLWQWLVDKCDLAGVVDPDWDLASFQIGMEVNPEMVSGFGDRVSTLESGKLFIPKFIEFQFGKTLNRANKVHLGVIRRLELIGIESPVQIVDETARRSFQGPSKDLESSSLAPSKDLQRGLQASMEKKKVYEKELVMDKEKNVIDIESHDLNVTSTTASLLNDIEAHIQSLKPEWRLAMTYAEQMAIRENLRSIESFQPGDWDILRDFLAAKLDKAEGFWQPWSRSKFVETIGDVHGSALRWASKNRRVRKEGWK